MTSWPVPLLPAFLVALLLPANRALAHHGGLPVPGSGGSPAVSLTWEQEVQSHGYRIKFLSEPREAEPGKPIRLVFEVQRVSDGIYEGGLTPLVRFGTKGKQVQVPAPEIEGVTGYYETRVSFPAQGQLGMSFETQGRGGTVVARFSKKRSSHPYATLGKTTVGMVSLLTVLGCLTSMYRRTSV